MFSLNLTRISLGIIRQYSKNHYEILNLKPQCSVKEIRDSFITLSKQHHPDAGATATKDSNSAEFRRVVEAYKILSKPESRANYDYNLMLSSSGVKSSSNLYQYGGFTLHKNVRSEYYGIKGLKKLANWKIVLMCFIFAGVGVAIQVFLIRSSITFKRTTLDEKSAEAGIHHANVRANAQKNSNEAQLKRLVENLKR